LGKGTSVTLAQEKSVIVFVRGSSWDFAISNAMFDPRLGVALLSQATDLGDLVFVPFEDLRHGSL
jgi:hypothetical protein